MKFLDLVSDLKIPYRTEGHHHCTEGWIQINCPFCADGSDSFHMGYNLSVGIFNCWRCGPHTTSRTLMMLTKLPYHKVKELGLKADHSIERVKKTGTLKYPSGVLDYVSKPQADYLRGRGFSPANLARLWGIQSIREGSPGYQWKIFIPIHLYGEVVSWTTRRIVDNEGLPRYRSAPQNMEAISHKTLLYGEDYCKQTIVIQEGPTDVWAIGPGAVCTFGIGYTEAQLIRMSKYPSRVICFDNEPEAQKRAKRLLSDLSVFSGETLNVRLSGKDAASSPKEERLEFRKAFLGS